MVQLLTDFWDHILNPNFRLYDAGVLMYCGGRCRRWVKAVFLDRDGLDTYWSCSHCGFHRKWGY